jgi:hypothetical protein
MSDASAFLSCMVKGEKEVMVATENSEDLVHSQLF